ncbi:MAG TPA: c-type cytochrome [Usitatibacter sp.]|nr:c-type cytochrome [Usitatibacter sp.]
MIRPSTEAFSIDLRAVRAFAVLLALAGAPGAFAQSRSAPRFATPNLPPAGVRALAANCAQCHGKDASGGGSAPTLNSSQFLKSTTDDQIFALVSGGVSGTEMPAWSLDYGGTFTAEQVRQVVPYLRSLEPNAPSIPRWRQGAKAGS